MCLLVGWTESKFVASKTRHWREYEVYKFNFTKKKTDEISFNEAIQFLSNIFGERNSLFHTKYKRLNLRKQEDEDFVSFAGNVNQQCERFNLKDLSIDMFDFCSGIDC